MRSCIFLLLLVFLTCIVPVPALPQTPVANFTIDPQMGIATYPVQFTDTSTGNPVSWSWDFGDGKSSALQNPRHTYSYLGIYTVSLKVTNAAGSNTSAPQMVYMADSGTPIPTTIAAQQKISAPYTITTPGIYTLGSDCRGADSSKDCAITIRSSDVTLDGGGHTLYGSGIIAAKTGTGTLSGITIKNLWTEGAGTGISLSGIDGARISNVTIVQTVSDGLSIYDSKNIRVENSVFLENVDFIGDPVYENAYHGGILLNGVEDAVITGCSFTDHANAIVLMGSKDATISSNYFHNNLDVLYHSAEGTKIFNNYISSVSISDGAKPNALNTTLGAGSNIVGGNRMGGNFWYKDDGKGYSQTCVDDNHSGICDSPYEISSPSALDKALRTDNYPLCGPVGSGKPVHPQVTPKAVHTIPTGAVYNQISPTLTTRKPTSTPKPADIASGVIILSVLSGAFLAYLRR